jgi:hypothetical protein
MRKAAAVLMIALLPSMAFAEEPPGPPTARTEAQKKEDAAIEKAYEQVTRAVRGRSSAPVKVDPWQGVRPAPPDNAKR